MVAATADSEVAIEGFARMNESTTSEGWGDVDAHAGHRRRETAVVVLEPRSVTEP